MSLLADNPLPQAPVPASDQEVLERREELRLSINVPVTVTVLGMHSDGIMKAQVLDASGKGMKVSVPLPIAAGAAVQVEAGDSLFLGEVCYSEPAEGGYIVGLTLSHSLNALAELDRLNRMLRQEEGNPANSTRQRALQK
jgi:hypothetical protein